MSVAEVYVAALSKICKLFNQGRANLRSDSGVIRGCHHPKKNVVLFLRNAQRFGFDIPGSTLRRALCSQDQQPLITGWQTAPSNRFLRSVFLLLQHWYPVNVR